MKDQKERTSKKEKRKQTKHSHRQRRTWRVEVHMYYEKDRITKEQTHSHWFGRLRSRCRRYVHTAYNSEKQKEQPTVLLCVIAGSRFSSTPPRFGPAAPLTVPVRERRGPARRKHARLEGQARGRAPTAMAISLDRRAGARSAYKGRGVNEDVPVLGDVLQDHQSPSAEGTSNPKGSGSSRSSLTSAKSENMPEETPFTEVKAL